MTSAVSIARRFWELMNANDFYAVGAALSPDFVLDWLQSGERIRGALNFGQMNAEYPAHGRWVFTVNRLFGDETEAVSDVDVTDGVARAKAISFFSVKDGKITRIVEYWPEPMPAQPNRAHLVEKQDA